MRFTDSYDAETEDGPARVRPMDTLIGVASLVPKESWETCPVCGRKCPLFFGDPRGEYWCAVCQITKEHPEIARQ